MAETAGGAPPGPGPVVLLAGGSGGLGAATARLLAQDGATLVIGYRSNHQRAAALRAALTATAPPVASEAARGLDRREIHPDIHLAQGDLEEPGVAEKWIEQCRTLGTLSAVAIFVGDPARAVAGEEEQARLLRSWSMNFLAPYRLARLAAEHMASERTPGSIVLLATMQAVAAFEDSIAYAAPKAALAHAVHILAREFGGDRNICVNAVAPGVIDAGMARASIAGGKYERYLAAKTIPRYGRPEDVARLVRLLLQPDCYITGQVITIDGGLTLRR